MLLCCYCEARKTCSSPQTVVTRLQPSASLHTSPGKHSTLRGSASPGTRRSWWHLWSRSHRPGGADSDISLVGELSWSRKTWSSASACSPGRTRDPWHLQRWYSKAPCESNLWYSRTGYRMISISCEFQLYPAESTFVKGRELSKCWVGYTYKYYTWNKCVLSQ